MTFRIVLQLLLRKSVKSLQLVLNEWTDQLDGSLSASALSQARHKLRHTAFIELLERGVIEVMYSDGDYEKFRGYRLLALDGTSLRLPNTKETRAKFGVIEHLNGNRTAHASQVEAKMTVLYDVLNRIPLSAQLHKGRTNDLKASKVHLAEMKEKDLVLADRAYGSYLFFHQILGRNADFAIRCKNIAFGKYHGLLSGNRRRDVTVNIPAPHTIRHLEGVPPELRIRFIRIVLDNGEIEILATSLLDKKRFPYHIFKKLYHQRWRVETYFQILKSRLCIDNFSGKSVEAILQDFYSTLFVSGLESIICSEANDCLRSRETKHAQQVNKAVSFHTIKDRVVRLIFDQPPDFQDQIKTLLLQSPTSVRHGRVKPPRIKCERGVDRRSLYFQRYAKKQVF